MKKKRNYEAKGSYRSPRTTNERRASYSSKYVRAKRNASNIPSSWDDINCCIQKTWKSKRKTQYRERSKKQKHVVYLPIEVYMWDLHKQLDYINVPFRIEDIKKSYCVKRASYKQIKDKYIRVWTYKYDYTNGKLTRYKHRQIGWAWTYKSVPGPVRTYAYSVVESYKLTYWSNHELNLDFLYHRRPY